MNTKSKRQKIPFNIYKTLQNQSRDKYTVKKKQTSNTNLRLFLYHQIQRSLSRLERVSGNR